MRIRAARGLSQEQLAKRAGMRQPRIADLEAAKGNPRLLTVAKVADALGVAVAELLTPAGVASATIVAVIPSPHPRGEFQDALLRDLYSAEGREPQLAAERSYDLPGTPQWAGE
jgi:transcriptional regulator with XRE-family HTH domain